MAADSDTKLSKQDLYILMESYKNNIQLNTTLLEQQKQLLILHDSSTAKQKELCEEMENVTDKQTKMCSEITTLIEKLTTCSKTLADNQLRIDEYLKEISVSVLTTSGKISLEHQKITNRIYVAMIGMGGIIIAIISMATLFAERWNSVTTILTKHIGAGG